MYKSSAINVYIYGYKLKMMVSLLNTVELILMRMSIRLSTLVNIRIANQ